MTRQRLAVLATAFTVTGVFSTGQDTKPAAVPVPERVESPKVPAVVSPDTTGLPIDPKSYVIGPEDILKVSVWREPELSKAVAVRPDGKITMSLIGDLQASGLTPERLTVQLREAYSEKVRNPEISVEVIQVNSKHYSITGGVNRPGMFPLVVPMTVFEALNLAGGFKDFANKKNITIIRADGNILHFNWQGFTKGDKKAKEQNVLLNSGDTIVVKD